MDILINQSLLDGLESLPSPHPYNLFINDFQEDLNKPLSHTKVIILINIPFRLLSNFNINWNNYFVTIDDGAESVAVFISHAVFLVFDEVVPEDVHVFDELVGCWWITDAFEELDAFFSFEVFEMPELSQEGHFFVGQLFRLASYGCFQGIRCTRWGLFRRLFETSFWYFV